MQKEERAACKNDAQDEDEECEASRMNPATSACPTPGIETARCCARSRSGRAEKREDHAGKEKEKEKDEESLWRRRSAFLSGLSSARSLKITWTHVKIACRHCEQDNRRGARQFSDCNSPGNWYTRIISSTFKRRFEISSRRYNLAIVLDCRQTTR